MKLRPNNDKQHGKPSSSVKSKTHSLHDFERKQIESKDPIGQAVSKDERIFFTVYCGFNSLELKINLPLLIASPNPLHLVEWKPLGGVQVIGDCANDEEGLPKRNKQERKKRGSGGGRPPLCQDISVRLASWLAAYCDIPNNVSVFLPKRARWDSFKKHVHANRSRIPKTNDRSFVPRPSLPPVWETYDETEGWKGRCPTVLQLVERSEVIAKRLGSPRLDIETTDFIVNHLGDFFWINPLQSIRERVNMSDLTLLTYQEGSQQDSGTPFKHFPDDQYLLLNEAYLAKAKSYWQASQVDAKAQVDATKAQVSSTLTTTPATATNEVVKDHALHRPFPICNDHTLVKDKEYDRYYTWWSRKLSKPLEACNKLFILNCNYPQDRIIHTDIMKYNMWFHVRRRDALNLHNWLKDSKPFEDNDTFNYGISWEYWEKLYREPPINYNDPTYKRIIITNKEDTRWNTHCVHWNKYIAGKYTLKEVQSLVSKLWKEAFIPIKVKKKEEEDIDEQLSYYFAMTEEIESISAVEKIEEEVLEGEYIPYRPEGKSLGLTAEALMVLGMNAINRYIEKKKIERAKDKIVYRKVIVESKEGDLDLRFLILKRGFKQLANKLYVPEYSYNTMLEDQRLINNLRS